MEFIHAIETILKFIIYWAFAIVTAWQTMCFFEAKKLDEGILRILKIAFAFLIMIIIKL